MDTRSTLPCSGLNKCTSLTTLIINYDHLELLKGNIPSSFQTPVTDLLGLICDFDHDKKKFTPGAWQMRIERTKSVFKYIWWIMNVHRGMCVASFDPFSAHMQTWFTAEMRKLKGFSFKASCSLNPHSPRLSLSKSPARGQSRQKSRVLTAQCRIQRYRSTLVPWFQTHCKAWAGISSDVDVSIMRWSPHSSRPHQMNLSYFTFHSCSLLPEFTMHRPFFSICFHRHDWRLQSDVLDFRWWCFQHFFLFKSSFPLLQSLVV